MSGRFRVDVVSVDDPDQPFHSEHIDAASFEKAHVAAAWIVAEHVTNPDLHYGDLWDESRVPAAYLCSIEAAPTAGGVR